MKYATFSSGAALGCLMACLAAIQPTSIKSPVWDASKSARYLDSREVYWQGWEHAARDPETQCVSCHTQVPYALARPLLRERLKETSLSAPEAKMLADVRKRVTRWPQVEPFYTDPEPTREIEARGTEAVLNALILTCYDAPQKRLDAVTKKAFSDAWDLQVKSGPTVGSWSWLNFQNEPWESVNSGYQGAVFMALAVGMAPDDYQTTPAIRSQLTLLRSYLQKQYAKQPLDNKILLLWASAKLQGLLTPAEQKGIAAETLALQRPDGGWSLTTFGYFKRKDVTELESKSDGYATGLTVSALQQSRAAPGNPRIQKALDWLGTNQDQQEGSWAAYSLNKQRDPKSNIGHFMADAATGFAVSALVGNK